MSLLNQVLQDLETRKANNSTEHQSFNHVVASSTPDHKVSYLILALICIALIAIFSSYKTKDSNKKVILAIPIPNKTAITTARIKETPAVVTTVNNTPLKPTADSENSMDKSVSTQVTVIKKTKPNQHAPSSPAVVKNTKQKDSQPTIKKPAVTQSLTAKQLDEQAFVSAQKLNNLSVKQLKLQQLLSLNPKHIPARLVLTNTLLQQGLVSEASLLLDQSLKLFPQNLNFIKLRSQIFIQNKQPVAAIELLQKAKHGSINDENHLALLAAAYQQNNQHIKSLSLYQKLLAIKPEKAEYWLGLAIAQEHQGNKHQALIAYQQAVNKKTLQNAVVSYINQRISSLK